MPEYPSARARRLAVTVVWAVAVIGGAYLAWQAARLYLWQPGIAGSYKYDILFETDVWLLPVTLAVGALFGGVATRYRNGDGEGWKTGELIRRHSPFGGFLEHWTVAIGVVLLMLSGIWLGFLFIPRLTTSTEQVGWMLNLHYVGTALLLFGVSAHAARYTIEQRRELVPSTEDFRQSVRDVGHYLGLTEKPPAGKYLPIQKVSYVVWAVLLGGVALTGAIKIADYIWNVSPGLKGVATLVHDSFALLIVAFFLVHLAVVLMPSHLPLLRSQISGTIPESYIKRHHPEWHDRLTSEEKEDE